MCRSPTIFLSSCCLGTRSSRKPRLPFDFPDKLTTLNERPGKTRRNRARSSVAAQRRLVRPSTDHELGRSITVTPTRRSNRWSAWFWLG